MVTHADNVKAQVALLLENAMAVPESVWNTLTVAQKKQALGFYVDKITALMTDEMALAKVRDTADVIVHAEGPALSSDNWSLKAVNYVGDSLNGALRGVVADNLIKLSSGTLTSKAIRQQIDVQVTGFAPGSLFVGAKVAFPDKSGLFGYEDVAVVVHNAVNSLPKAGAFVMSEKISDEISDVLEDPVLRDSAIVATLMLAPTGRKGVDSISVSGAGENGCFRAVLTPEKKSVLKKAVSAGAIGKSTGHGKIKGIVREINLDTKRFSLRSDDGFLVRCFLGGLDYSTASSMLGKEVVVEGNIQKDREGRVRLISLSASPMILPTA